MAFEALLAQADELKALERDMQNPDCPPDVLQRYGTVLSRFEHGGGYTYANRIQQTLSGLGFAETDYQRPSPNFPAANAPAPSWRACCWTSPTCCCWMNPATIWTSPRWSGWKPGCAIGTAQW
jgi:hypothetical protein